jgi:hypothetical protein
MVSEEKMLDALAVILEDARTRGAYSGLHCGAARPLGRMRRVKPDIISFDAHEGLELFFSDSHAVDFVHQGGIVAYGIVPRERRERSRFRQNLSAMATSGISGRRSPGICATRHDHGNLRAGTSRPIFDTTVVRRCACHQQND